MKFLFDGYKTNRVTVEIERGCVACGYCFKVCPKVFLLSAQSAREGSVAVTNDTFRHLRRAQAGCPLGLINVQRL